MGDYHLVRVWQLKAGCTGGELEALTASGYLEMQRWIPGVKHIALIRADGDGDMGSSAEGAGSVRGRQPNTTLEGDDYDSEISGGPAGGRG